jgi:hypothetical protein
MLVLPQIERADNRCRAEFIRPTAIIAIGDKEATMACDALRRGASFPAPSGLLHHHGCLHRMTADDETSLVE